MIWRQVITVTVQGTRANRTRGALLDAGMDLLAERPIESIAIDDLVAAAGVAKGSFFNHFADKNDFADAVAVNLRAAMEAAIRRANADVVDPVQRLARGMLLPVEIALSQPAVAKVLLRAAARTTLAEHPLNRGIRADIKMCVAKKLLRPDAAGVGIVFWLGVCQAATRNIIERALPRPGAAAEAAKHLVLGLTGLGIESSRVARVAADGGQALRSAALQCYLTED